MGEFPTLESGNTLLTCRFCKDTFYLRVIATNGELVCPYCSKTNKWLVAVQGWSFSHGHVKVAAKTEALIE